MKSSKLTIILLAIITIFIFTNVNTTSGLGYLNPNQYNQSCTIFTVSIGDKALFCNNEDLQLPNTYLWFIPSQEYNSSSGTKPTYGAVFVGFDNNHHQADGYVQGGMNTQGLCFDGNGLPVIPMNPHPELEETHIYYHIHLEIPWICSNINETINYYQTHNFGSAIACQSHYADASGDAVVVSGNSEGERAYTSKGNVNFLISTNFNRAYPENGYGYCTRYLKALNMLGYIKSEGSVTVDACDDVLRAVSNSQTSYSYIFDPVTHDIYIYYNRNFENYIKLNLDRELAKVGFGATGAQTKLGTNIWDYGGISSKAIRIADLFAPSSPNPFLSFPFLFGVIMGGITLVAIVIVSTIFLRSYFMRRRT